MRHKYLLVVLLLVIPIAGGYLFALRDRTVPTLQTPVYQGDSTTKSIALTFNVDWGEEYIPAILETCQEHNIKVTFFVTGRWAQKFPQLTRQMAREGHEIGSHGYGHPHPNYLSVEQNLADIKKAEKVLIEILGRKPSFYAPPYGEHGPTCLQAAEQGGYRTILWSVDSIDWKFRDRDIIFYRVINKAHNGAIILLHPTEATAAALPSIIKELQRQNYSLVTLSDMLSR